MSMQSSDARLVLKRFCLLRFMTSYVFHSTNLCRDAIYRVQAPVQCVPGWTR